MSLGNRIRSLRIKKGLTQLDIASYLKMGRSNFGHIENDRVIPSSEDLQKIADILQTTTDFLLGRDGQPDPAPPWASAKDIRDFKKMLEEDTPVMFDGVPIEGEDKEKVLRVMEAIFWDAKKKNKRKPIEE